jgi:hypothetical protein
MSRVEISTYIGTRAKLKFNGKNVSSSVQGLQLAISLIPMLLELSAFAACCVAAVAIWVLSFSHLEGVISQKSKVIKLAVN